jgi:ribosomal protein S18 acetylase RimI-like enzyme
MINTPIIKKAGTEELQKVFEVIKLCTARLEEEGLDHWTKYYSNFDEFLKRIADQNAEVFIAETNGSVSATIAISNTPPKYFTNSETAEVGNILQFYSEVEPAKIAYLSALAVSPEFQGQGLGRFMLAWAEETLAARRITSIRFDTRAENKPAVKLYESMDYKIVYKESISNDENYYFYEKIIK